VVVARLQSEFPYVASSEEDGRRYVRAIVKQLSAIKQIGEIPVDSEYLDRLDRAQNGAIYVYFEDPSCATTYLSTVVIPGEPLFFYYSSSAHERATQALLSRCAAALDYEIVNM